MTKKCLSLVLSVLLFALFLSTPLVYCQIEDDATTVYFRGDEYTTFNQTGYGLDTTNSDSAVTVTATGATLSCGIRVYLLRTSGEQELTSGIVANLTRSGDGAGLQTNTYSMSAEGLRTGDECFLIRLYINDVLKALFISEVILSDSVEASTWTFQAYTNKTGTALSVTFGSSSYSTQISGIDFAEPPLIEQGLYYFGQNDWITFFLLPYTNLIGAGPFASIILFGFGVTAYIRTKQFYFILLICILLSLGGVLNLIMGNMLWGFLAIMLTFALGGLYWRVFR